MQSARGESCTCRTPACNFDSETCVCAHANGHEYGKGMGQKAHDLFVAYACSGCHSYIDQHKRDADFYWRRGHVRTLIRLVEKGILVIK